MNRVIFYIHRANNRYNHSIPKGLNRGKDWGKGKKSAKHDVLFLLQ